MGVEIVDWNPAISCQVSLLSTSVTTLRCLTFAFSFATFFFSFVVLIVVAFARERVAIPDRCCVFPFAYAVAIASAVVVVPFVAVALSLFSFTFVVFTFVFAFALVDGSDVHWRLSFAIVCCYARGAWLQRQLCEGCSCRVVFHDCCSGLRIGCNCAGQELEMWL